MVRSLLLRRAKATHTRDGRISERIVLPIVDSCRREICLQMKSVIYVKEPLGNYSVT